MVLQTEWAQLRLPTQLQSDVVWDLFSSEGSVSVWLNIQHGFILSFLGAGMAGTVGWSPGISHQVANLSFLTGHRSQSDFLRRLPTPRGSISKEQTCWRQHSKKPSQKLQGFFKPSRRRNSVTYASFCQSPKNHKANGHSVRGVCKAMKLGDMVHWGA